MGNTQLPAEVLEEIDNKAASYARKNGAGRFAWRDGATEYATKLHQERQTVKVLEYDNNRLQGEVEGYREAYDDHKRLVKDIDNIITGGMPAKQASLCDLVEPIRSLQEKHNAAVALLEKVIYRHEGGLLPDRLLHNEIKTFLDGKLH